MSRAEIAAGAAIVAVVASVAIVFALSFVRGESNTPVGGPSAQRMPTLTPTPTPAPTGAPTTTPTPLPQAPELVDVPGRISWQGDDWFLLGVNVPWYNWGCDFGCGQSEGVSSPAVRAAVSEEFQRLEEAGVHVVRWWVFPGEDPKQIIRDEQRAPGGLDPAVYQDFDAALELAEEHDLYYVFTLFSSPADLPAAWLVDPAQRSQLVDAVSELFARYGENPRIMTWQVFNEPEWSIWNGDVSRGAVKATVREIADAVHANSNAYVSVGSAHLGGLAMWVGQGLDYYTAHWYDPMSSGSACARCTRYAVVQYRYKLDAPLVIGEFFAGPTSDAVERFQDWDAKGFAGAWAWSLFPDRTLDKMEIDLEAAATFASGNPDVGPRGSPPPARALPPAP